MGAVGAERAVGVEVIREEMVVDLSGSLSSLCSFLSVVLLPLVSCVWSSVRSRVSCKQ